MPPPELFRHQRELLERTEHERAWAIFWECGCGKSSPVIHNVARTFQRGEIDGAIIVSPRGVHRAWCLDEIPRHCAVRWRALDWHSDRGKGQDRAFAQLLETPLRSELPWLSVTFDAVLTPRGRQAVLDFVKRFPRFFLVIDESSRVKNPTAQRTKKVAALRKLATFVRILNGTPVTAGATDIYSQMKILDDNFWIKHGIGSWTAFQAKFCVFRKIVVGGEDDSERPRSRGSKREPIVPHGANADSVAAYEQLDLDQLLSEVGGDPTLPTPQQVVTREGAATTGRTIEVVVGYRELDKLHDMVMTKASRLTKEQAGLDLPPKLYNRIVFDLHPDQRRAYDTLRREYMLELDSGTLVTASLALVRITRLQQVACGFLPDVDNPAMPPQRFPRDGINPRLQHLLELSEDLPPTIVWARFTLDVDEICRALGPASCVRYDGEVSGKNRDLALKKFSDGNVKFIIAKASSMGVGLTINRASAQVFYSNTFSLLDREQAENRCHRPGQHRAVTYYDLIAYKTVDEKILRSLKENAEIASRVTGDAYRAWLEET